MLPFKVQALDGTLSARWLTRRKTCRPCMLSELESHIVLVVVQQWLSDQDSGVVDSLEILNTQHHWKNI